MKWSFSAAPSVPQKSGRSSRLAAPESAEVLSQQPIHLAWLSSLACSSSPECGWSEAGGRHKRARRSNRGRRSTAGMAAVSGAPHRGFEAGVGDGEADQIVGGDGLDRRPLLEEHAEELDLVAALEPQARERNRQLEQASDAAARPGDGASAQVRG